MVREVSVPVPVLRAELQQNIRHQAGDDNRITGAADAHESPRQCRLQNYTIFTHLSRGGPHIRQLRRVLRFCENHIQVPAGSRQLSIYAI